MLFLRAISTTFQLYTSYEKYSCHLVMCPQSVHELRYWDEGLVSLCTRQIRTSTKKKEARGRTSIANIASNLIPTRPSPDYVQFVSSYCYCTVLITGPTGETSECEGFSTSVEEIAGKDVTVLQHLPSVDVPCLQLSH